jgi:hypothetical protein
VPSGLLDYDKNIVIGHLHRAIKPVNQLKMMEDALVIYRIARAPERRIFYIDVGNLPKLKAEQYLKDIMARYRNKIVYDSSTGEIRDDRKMMSTLEDFWLPRREGGRGTEIDTLPGGENLGQIDSAAHVLESLIAKSIHAKKLGLKEVEVWGDGSPKRTFLHVKDLAQATIHVALYANELPSIVNVNVLLLV